MDEIVVFQPSQNLALSTTLTNLEGAFLSAATQNLDAYLETSGDDYTAVEKHAMVVIEQLKLVNGMDLAAILLRGKLVKQIREEGLWTRHPNGYASIEDMAKDQGIAPSELSNSITLCEVIFPYITETMHLSVANTWEQIGKSNFRELIPTLQGIITGQPSPRVATEVAARLNDTAATLRATRQANGDTSDPTPEEINVSAITTLFEQGAAMTNTVLRNTIRPTRTPPVNCTMVNANGRRTLIATLTDEQLEALRHKVGTFLDPVSVDLSADRATRQRQVRDVRDLRDLVTLFNGS
jgi:hypothetical protein